MYAKFYFKNKYFYSFYRPQIMRGYLRGEGLSLPAGETRGVGVLLVDLAAVSRLDEVRTADLTQSRENLKSVEPRLGHG
jgi:hypothetical protein